MTTDNNKAITPSTEINLTLEDQLASADPSVIIKKQTGKDITKDQVIQIITKIQKTKEVSFKTALQAVAALFRKGAANAGAVDSMSVEVYCPDAQITTEINRYDVVMAMQSIANHKNVRKLAEALAPEMLSANLKLIKKNPLLDLKGDLANRINRKLALRKEESLTREEEICCCTYAQWMPNLNELANSSRLKGLLDEDLFARKKRKKQAKKTGNSSFSKQDPKIPK